MICARCHRPLWTSKVWMQTKSGRLFYGPKCARIMGLLDVPKWQRREGMVRPRVVSRQSVAADPRQIPLEFQA